MINTAPTSFQRERASSTPRAESARRFPTWGIVDAILALVMLPFGIGFLLIDALVTAIGAFTNRVSSHTGGLRRAAAR